MSSDVITGDVAERDVALPFATPTSPRERARARTRVHARVPATLRDAKLFDAKVWGAKPVAVVRDTAATVRADLAGSWLLHNQPPALAQLWSARKPDVQAMPGQSQALWWADVVWRHAALVLYGLVFGYLWLLHRAVTGVPTVLITAALVGMWFTSGGGAR